MLEPKWPVMIGAKFSVDKAHDLQLSLSRLVIKEDMLPKRVHYVAGADVAYTADLSIGAVAILDYDSLMTVEFKRAKVKTRFPYIRTLLSFREIAPTLSAIRKLRTQPDVFLVDGQGVAHPYHLGFASHLGLIIDKPTIGVAKSLLCGEVGAFNKEGWAPITDKDKVIGAAVAFAQKRQKPMYVSVGHKVSLKRAIEIFKHCAQTRKIPEPIWAAHAAATEEKKRLEKGVGST